MDDLTEEQKRKFLEKEFDKLYLWKKQSKARSCMCGCYKVLLFVIVSYAFLYLLASVALQSPDIRRRFEQNTVNLEYPIRRSFRHWTLPLMKWIGFNNIPQELSETPCLIPNPTMFLFDDVSCDECRDVTSILVLEPQQEYSVTHNQPVVAKGCPEIMYEELIGINGVQENHLSQGVKNLECSEPAYTTVADLLGNETSASLNHPRKDRFYCTWTTESILASHLLRKLHKRSAYLPERAEVSLVKTVYLGGRMSKTGEQMREGQMEMQWFHQSHGVRKIFLEPSDCRGECKTLKVVLQPGDTLFFSQRLWRARLDHSLEMTYLIGIQGSYESQ